MKTNKLWLIDCIENKRAVIENGPFVIGESPDVDLQVSSLNGGPQELLIEASKIKEGYQILPAGGIDHFYFDGQEATIAVVNDKTTHTLIVAGHPFVLRQGKDRQVKDWLAAIDPSVWHVYQRSSQQWQGPFAPSQLPSMVSTEPGEYIVMCQGMKEMGFYAHHIIGTLGVPTPSTNSSQAIEPIQQIPTHQDFDTADSEIDTEYGEFTCPVCWFRFDRGDVMNIAVHADLRGDPILGEEHMLRFHATRFNDRNQALDAMGTTAPDSACPHCRRRLPPGFLDQPHHIFSIVGAPSSGKSYYISVLVKLLQRTIYKNFAATFRDAAPEDNAVLNDMRNHLFSASKPEEAYLAKTELEGALYETLPRQGRQVRLPKPFVFHVSSEQAVDDGFSLVFYDNAGEHFEPGTNSADSPGAQHISVASGIFFLFDPLYSPDFRARIKSCEDPQLLQQRNDQQDVILSESEVRIKQILGLSTSERIATPLAVIVGKSDAWIEMLGTEPLKPLFEEHNGQNFLMTANIQENSSRIRDLLMEVSPGIVANAESISSNVCYFAMSSLGHSPVTFTDKNGEKHIGPDPQKLNPQRVEDATLWVLAQLAPGIFHNDQHSG